VPFKDTRLELPYPFPHLHPGVELTWPVEGSWSPTTTSSGKAQTATAVHKQSVVETTESPKVEQPPRKEEPKKEIKKEEPKEAPRKEEVKMEDPKKEEPKPSPIEPKKEELKAASQEPKKEEPKKEEPKATPQESKKEEPKRAPEPVAKSASAPPAKKEADVPEKVARRDRKKGVFQLLLDFIFWVLSFFRKKRD